MFIDLIIGLCKFTQDDNTVITIQILLYYYIT